ncbi:MAG TPA: SDR family oxidoreductase [Rhizomicrobium sp.]|jgi:3-oxoacyl-[acyl-carrier protein] reductase|nr:SDR family oxidoreductase [Rhizomicrobium sp.]
MEQRDLKGKVAIVTGSASGIGAAVALGLAQRGASVVVNYAKSEAEAQAVGEAVRKAGAGVRVMQADVGRDADCRRLAAAAMEGWGRIDILVNNAGTTKFAAHADLDALSAEDFSGIYATNVIGPFQMVRACRDALKASGDGSIVNVSSIAGVAGVGSSIAYAASKGALNTMTLSLARALAPEIRVNAVCPGYVATPWFSKRFGEENSKRIADQQADANPLKRVATAEDIADSVLFLVGAGSRNISGEMLLIDSGMHLNMIGTKR